MKDTINFLLAGVGGQGTILASDVLVNVGLAAGYQAKQAEVHGMSQRGGSVTSHVRWGKVVYSPLIGAGEADVLLAFEKAEALRNLSQLRYGALAVVNMQAIEPITVTSGGQPYPEDDHLRAILARVSDIDRVCGWRGDRDGIRQRASRQCRAAGRAVGAARTRGVRRAATYARDLARRDHTAGAAALRRAQPARLRRGPRND